MCPFEKLNVLPTSGEPLAQGRRYSGAQLSTTKLTATTIPTRHLVALLALVMELPIVHAGELFPYKPPELNAYSQRQARPVDSSGIESEADRRKIADIASKIRRLPADQIAPIRAELQTALQKAKERDDAPQVRYYQEILQQTSVTTSSQER